MSVRGGHGVDLELRLTGTTPVAVAHNSVDQGGVSSTTPAVAALVIFAGS